MDDVIDFTGVYDPTMVTDWRAEAARLAYDRKLAGRAWLARRADGVESRTEIGQLVYETTSVHNPDDHTVLFDPKTSAITCDCEAGQHRRPCAHAGAVLLLRARLAREYHRPRSS